MNKSKIVRDNISIKDELCFTAKEQKKAFKTKIICVDDFGNQLWEDENMTTLGGALFTLMKTYGVDKAPVDIATINELLGIADGPIMPLNDNNVCLFGIGSGGAGEVAGQTKEVKVQERTMNKFIPMRVVTTELPAAQQDKYWMKKEVNDGLGTTMYYLKSIQGKELKCLWKDGADGEDGSPVGDDVWNTMRTDPIEAFVELTLRIDPNDGVEWFDYIESTEVSSFSELGLFTGIRNDIGGGEEEYQNVWLHSKLNVPTEILYSKKGLTFYYRIYLM